MMNAIESVACVWQQPVFLVFCCSAVRCMIDQWYACSMDDSYQDSQFSRVAANCRLGDKYHLMKREMRI